MNLSLPEVVGIAPSTQRNKMAHWKNFVLFYRDLMNQVYPIPKRSVEFVILEKYASFLIYKSTRASGADEVGSRRGVSLGGEDVL